MSGYGTRWGKKKLKSFIIWWIKIDNHIKQFYVTYPQRGDLILIREQNKRGDQKIDQGENNKILDTFTVELSVFDGFLGQKRY